MHPLAGGFAVFWILCLSWSEQHSLPKFCFKLKFFEVFNFKFSLTHLFTLFVFCFVWGICVWCGAV